MGRVTTRVRRTRLDVDTGDRVDRTDTVAVEEPLEIRVGDEPLTTTMRTPGDDFDLAIGHLLTEAMLHSASRGRHPDALHRPRRGRLPHLQRRRRDPGAGRGPAPAGPRAHRDHLERVRRLRLGDASTPCAPAAATTSPRMPSPSRPRCWPGCPRPCGPGSRSSTAPVGCTRPALATPERRAARGPRGRRPAQRRRQGHRRRGPRARAAVQRNASSSSAPGRASRSCRRRAWPASPWSSRWGRASSLAVELATQAGITLVAFARPPHLSVYSRPDRLLGGDVADVPASSVDAIARAAPMG